MERCLLKGMKELHYCFTTFKNDHYDFISVLSIQKKQSKCQHNMFSFQPHLALCYPRRIALILCGAHESEIYFEVQLGVN